MSGQEVRFKENRDAGRYCYALPLKAGFEAVLAEKTCQRFLLRSAAIDSADEETFVVENIL